MIIVKRKAEPRDLIKWAATLPNFLELATLTDGRKTTLYDYQRDAIDEQDRLVIMNKARQVGCSYADALGELARIHLGGTPTTSIFVSLNRDEAKEKIRFARMAWEGMPSAWRLPLVIDSTTTLEFEAKGQDGRPYYSRIMSHPQRPVRGKTARIFFDEFAHWGFQKLIYDSALPAIIRGRLSLKIRSTPFGQNNLFHEIWSNEAKYPGFKRVFVPWWACPDFCRDLKGALAAAPALGTKERVERFGSPAILEAYQNSSDLDIFQQEYEGGFIDEQTAYFPYELIYPCTADTDQIAIAQDVEELAKRKCGPLCAGFDVGRTGDASEFWIWEFTGTTWEDRVLITMKKTPFEQQRAVIWRALDLLPTLRIAIDANGIGSQLAEETQTRYNSRVSPYKFTSEEKESMAVTFRRALETRTLKFRRTREIIDQIHSVKRIVLAGGKFRYDADRSGGHHADKLWAAALAIHLGSTPQPSKGLEDFYEKMGRKANAGGTGATR